MKEKIRTDTMGYSICIPNYNYGDYIGRTIQSVLDQTYDEFEILVSDNASSDNSVEVVRGFNDERVEVHVNRCNVGFAGNLDRAARHATSERMIMSSSDDLMKPDALETYDKFLNALGTSASQAIVSSSADIIDSNDNLTGRLPPEWAVWKETDRVTELESVVDAPVYRVSVSELLRRCLTTMKSPFMFASTCYPRKLYESVEGYGGNRVINPDKWFSWKLMGVAETAYFIDRPLFSYRVHASNQNSLQASAGALKFMVDEYLSSIEVDPKWLELTGLTKAEVEQAFVEQDVARHGLATLARGERLKAKRVLRFGKAVYPWHVRRNRKAWMLAGLLALGPVGTRIARRAYQSYQQRGNEKAETE